MALQAKFKEKADLHFLFKPKIRLEMQSAQLSDGHLFINRSYQVNSFQLPEFCIKHELEILKYSSNFS